MQTVLRGTRAYSVRLVKKVLNGLIDSSHLLEYNLARRLVLEDRIG